jgi:DNA repair protein RecN (Recombination protein N)
VLKSLFIRNYAIIEELSLDLQSQFTALTGETGAGKSILMGALGLILGDRSDSKSFRNPEEKCIVEGIFTMPDNPAIRNLLEQQEFDILEDICIRRELSPQGRSRVFVNDTPATLQFLHELTVHLIDLHRQFDTLELQRSENQLAIIDVLASNQSRLEGYQQKFEEWQEKKQLVADLSIQLNTLQSESDYNRFIAEEIEKFNPQPNEIEELESELLRLTHAESIKSALHRAVFLLHDSQEPALQQIKLVIQQLDSYTDKLKELETITPRLKSVWEELKDIHQDLDCLSETMFHDEERIQKITERLNEGNRLLKKHNFQQTSQLIDYHIFISNKLLGTDDLEAELQLHKQELAVLEIQLNEKAQDLSTHRQKQFKKLEKEVKIRLTKVGMAKAEIKVELKLIPLSYLGIDDIQFLFDANQSGQFQPIRKVASGGELSRLMLCMKSIVAGKTQLPTLIFDEIDSGISGETAVQVGQIMKDLAENHQLIAITHLPQIAAKANHHLFIYKGEDKHGKVTTKIRKLEATDRVDILAEMLSGKSKSNQSKVMAEELLRS